MMNKLKLLGVIVCLSQTAGNITKEKSDLLLIEEIRNDLEQNLRSYENGNINEILAYVAENTANIGPVPGEYYINRRDWQLGLEKFLISEFSIISSRITKAETQPIGLDRAWVYCEYDIAFQHKLHKTVTQTKLRTSGNMRKNKTTGLWQWTESQSSVAVSNDKSLPNQFTLPASDKVYVNNSLPAIKEIQQFLKEYFASKDAETAANFYDENAIVIGSDASEYFSGKLEIKEAIANFLTNYEVEWRNITLYDVRFHDDNHAWIYTGGSGQMQERATGLAAEIPIRDSGNIVKGADGKWRWTQRHLSIARADDAIGKK